MNKYYKKSQQKNFKLEREFTHLEIKSALHDNFTWLNRSELSFRESLGISLIPLYKRVLKRLEKTSSSKDGYINLKPKTNGKIESLYTDDLIIRRESKIDENKLLKDIIGNDINPDVASYVNSLNLNSSNAYLDKDKKYEKELNKIDSFMFTSSDAKDFIRKLISVSKIKVSINIKKDN
ncbi:hypothetical protein [Poseidonibacter ostreae]|uniref:Uncharacterized protein n=1 Tax=Poseidonibacter ostreae TaxID=2654171 RepID=A0A6L4WWY7_9BACT|nr:hypothetical protein [Poseidonibacter ostreae]KAB7891253.1 hypothetical protein GBG19_00020 [Poseidonibacter ostreae]